MMDAFYDDFTSPTLDPRWSLMWGTYAPPGLVGDIGLLAEGAPVGKSFDITVTAQVGPSTSRGVAIALVGVDLDFSMEVLWHSNGGTIAARPHGLTSPVVLTDSAAGVQEVTLRRYSGSWAVLADGVELDLPLFGKYFPDESEGDITVGLTVAAGSTMTSVDYRPTSGVVLTQETISEVVAFGESIKEVYAGPDLVWQASQALPVVTITGTSGTQSRDQFRAACIQYGTTYSSVTHLPFELDTSSATNLHQMFLQCRALETIPPIDTSNVTVMSSTFEQCSALNYVPDLDTAKVTTVNSIFYACPNLRDGNVRLIGKKAGVNESWAILQSGLTRVPFFSSAGQPI